MRQVLQPDVLLLAAAVLCRQRPFAVKPAQVSRCRQLRRTRQRRHGTNANPAYRGRKWCHTLRRMHSSRRHQLTSVESVRRASSTVSYTPTSQRPTLVSGTGLSITAVSASASAAASRNSPPCPPTPSAARTAPPGPRRTDSVAIDTAHTPAHTTRTLPGDTGNLRQARGGRPRNTRKGRLCPPDEGCVSWYICDVRTKAVRQVAAVAVLRAAWRCSHGRPVRHVTGDKTQSTRAAELAYMAQLRRVWCNLKHYREGRTRLWSRSGGVWWRTCDTPATTPSPRVRDVSMAPRRRLGCALFRRHICADPRQSLRQHRMVASSSCVGLVGKTWASSHAVDGHSTPGWQNHSLKSQKQQAVSVTCLTYSGGVTRCAHHAFCCDTIPRHGIRLPELDNYSPSPTWKLRWFLSCSSFPP